MKLILRQFYWLTAYLLSNDPPFLKNHLCWVFVAVFRLSAVVAHRLSCPMACGIFVPQAGIKPASPSNGRWILNHWTHQGSPIPLPLLFQNMPVGREKKFFFFILHVCAYCKTNSSEPFLDTGCWVGVRVPQIPSPLLLVFLPKAGNESGQASYSRISSDLLKPRGRKFQDSDLQ